MSERISHHATGCQRHLGSAPLNGDDYGPCLPRDSDELIERRVVKAEERKRERRTEIIICPDSDRRLRDWDRRQRQRRGASQDTQRGNRCAAIKERHGYHARCFLDIGHQGEHVAPNGTRWPAPSSVESAAPKPTITNIQLWLRRRQTLNRPVPEDRLRLEDDRNDFENVLVDLLFQFNAEVASSPVSKLVEAAQNAVECAVTDSDHCPMCSGDADKHVDGCAIQFLADALAPYSHSLARDEKGEV